MREEIFKKMTIKVENIHSINVDSVYMKSSNDAKIDKNLEHFFFIFLQENSAHH